MDEGIPYLMSQFELEISDIKSGCSVSNCDHF